MADYGIDVSTASTPSGITNTWGSIDSYARSNPFNLYAEHGSLTPDVALAEYDSGTTDWANRQAVSTGTGNGVVSTSAGDSAVQCVSYINDPSSLGVLYAGYLAGAPNACSS
ncbi:hypothetical protein GCM10023158_31670 [Gluconacetobacter tumulicola]